MCIRDRQNHGKDKEKSGELTPGAKFESHDSYLVYPHIKKLEKGEKEEEESKQIRPSLFR